MDAYIPFPIILGIAYSIISLYATAFRTTSSPALAIAVYFLLIGVDDAG